MPWKARCHNPPTKAKGHNLPRPYDLDDPLEIRRLYLETLGYLRTCEMMGHGTDLDGRRFAQAAFRSLADRIPLYQSEQS